MSTVSMPSTASTLSTLCQQTGNRPPDPVGGSDPGFGGLLAKCYADEGLLLPEFISNSALVRANRYFLHPDHPERNVALAHMLNLGTSQTQNVLQAAMICQGVSLESLARLFRLEADVIWLYDVCFWNVMDRREDSRYIRRLYLQGASGESTGAPNYWEHDLFSIAFKSRRLDLVLTAAGIAVPDGDKIPLEKRLENIRRNHLISSLEALASETLDDQPGLKVILKTIRKKNENTHNQQESPPITAAQSIGLILEKMRPMTVLTIEVGDRALASINLCLGSTQVSSK